MKLCDMNAEELRNALFRLTEPVCHVMADDRVQTAFDALSREKVDQLPLLKGLRVMLGELSPLLFQRHWMDMLEITSVLTGKPVRELQAQNGIATMADLLSCMEEDLGAFFSSAADFPQDA